MGLDTSHDCWHGAYSAFTRWRNKLAVAAGYGLTKGEHGIEFAALDWDSIPESSLLGDWPEMPKDPLLVLLAHSDCGGVIRAAHATALADRLTELLPKLDGDGGGHVGLYREKTQQFINGLRMAALRGEDVDFH